MKEEMNWKPAPPEARLTDDVVLVIKMTSRLECSRLEERLRALGTVSRIDVSVN